MQFSLRTLFLVMLGLSLVCGVLFAAPVAIAAIVLAVVLWSFPAFWITGMIYSRGVGRAFFIGGVAGGAMPYLVTITMSISIGSGYAYQFVYRFNPTGLFTIEPLTNLGLAIPVVMLGVVSLIGGGIGVWVYRMFGPRGERPSPPMIQTSGVNPFDQTETSLSAKK